MSAKGTPWFKLHTNLRGHPKVEALAEHLDMPEYAVMGLLVSMWCWAMDYCPDGDISNTTGRILERKAGWEGQKGVLYQALIACRFIDASRHRTPGQGCSAAQLAAVSMQLGAATLHNLCHYNESYNRALGAQKRRKTQHKQPPTGLRHVSKVSHDSVATGARLFPEKRRDINKEQSRRDRNAAPVDNSGALRHEQDQHDASQASPVPGHPETRPENQQDPASVAGTRLPPFGLPAGPGGGRAKAEERHPEETPTRVGDGTAGANFDAPTRLPAELQSLVGEVANVVPVRGRRATYSRADLGMLCDTYDLGDPCTEQLGEAAQACLRALDAAGPWSPTDCVQAARALHESNQQPTLARWLAAMHKRILGIGAPAPSEHTDACAAPGAPSDERGSHAEQQPGHDATTPPEHTGAGQEPVPGNAASA